MNVKNFSQLSRAPTTGQRPEYSHLSAPAERLIECGMNFDFYKQPHVYHSKMSELRKANTGHSYFITLSVVGWVDIFTRKRYSDKIIESLKFCTRHKGLEVFAYVIMPSHIHLVARSLKGNLGEILRDFKSFTAKEFIKMVEYDEGESRREWLLHMFRYYAKFQKQNAHYMFWQKTNHPIELNYPEIIDQKIEYIHHNPVAAGYVTDPAYWYYSSACCMSPLKTAYL